MSPTLNKKKVELSYYLSLYPAYFISLLCYWLIDARFLKNKDIELIHFDQPLRELLYAVGAIFLCLGIGQLYMQGYLLPHKGYLSFLTESLNQVLIFLPFPLLLIFRQQAIETAWIQVSHRPRSIGIGLGLAALAIAVFLLGKGNIKQYTEVWVQVYSPQNLPHLVQVFFEDFAIALCFVRFQAWLGKRKAIWIIALLFAAAHIPAMLADGVSPATMTSLLLDAGLGILVLSILNKSQDILWFWMLHFALDMMQFVH